MAAETQGSDRAFWRRLTPYAVGVVVAFALYPFASFLNRNRQEIPQTGRLAVYALFTVALGLGALVSLMLLRPATPADRMATGVAAFLVGFFGFHLLFASDPVADRRLLQLLAWAVLTALFVLIAYRFSRFAPLRTFVLVLAVALTALPLGEYLVWRFGGNDASADASVEVESPEKPPEVEIKPNVYYFLLDEYGRNDQLLDVLDFDNGEFHEELRERDFVVADDAHAPYQQTVLSMASVLDMDYVATTPAEAPDGNMPFANRLRGQNETVEYFKSIGYDYVYSSPGVFDWQRCDTEIVDLCIEAQATGINLDEMELSLLDLTPLGSLDIAKERITDPAYVVQQLDEHRDEVASPFFLYAHVLNPHGPFRYNEACDLRAQFAEPESTKSDLDRRNYVQDVGCLNDKILEAVDVILDDDPDAIVIVASDHGSKFIPDGYKRLEEWRPSAIREEFGAQWSIHLPDQCRASAEELVNTIDTFRVVTACLEGRAVGWADDRALIWPATGPGPQEVDDLSVLDPVS